MYAFLSLPLHAEFPAYYIHVKGVNNVGLYAHILSSYNAEYNLLSITDAKLSTDNPATRRVKKGPGWCNGYAVELYSGNVRFES
jgi:hypothetical protein